MKQILISDPAVWQEVRRGTLSRIVITQETASLALQETVELRIPSGFDEKLLADRPLFATVGDQQTLPYGLRAITLFNVRRH